MPTQPEVLRRVSPALAAGFVAVSAQVALAGHVPGERRLLSLVVLSPHAALEAPARLVDRATDSAPVALLTSVVVVVLLGSGARRAGVLVAVSVGTVLLGNPLLKRLVDRPRPELLATLEGVSPLSFPSGHAAATAALATAVVLSAPPGRPRRAVLAAAALLVLVTAASQLLLARHHPSDLLAGWLWAASLTTAVFAVGLRPPRTRPSAGGD